MQTIDEREVQTQWEFVLTTIEQKGESFLIYRNGEPIADLTPHTQHKQFVKSEQVQEEIHEADPLLEKLRPVIRAGLIIPHSKKLRKASMPTIEVEGKPLSQIIIEDRR